MDLFLAVVTNSTLKEGNYETVLGIFSTPQKAVEALKTQWNFSKARQISQVYWEYVYDGELTIYFEVRNAELDIIAE